MSSEQPNPDAGSRPPNDPSAFTQEIQYSQVTARVPEKVARGSFSTGALVIQGPHEFVIDFVLNMVQPHQIVSRVVLPPSIMPSFLAALRENLNNYTQRFGPPPTLPTPPPPPTPPSIEDIYKQ